MSKAPWCVGPVGADQAAAVDGEDHRQVLQGHVVDQLVVGALQEGRIDRDDRLQALAGEAGGEGDGMLLGDADIEVAVGYCSAKRTMPEPSRIAGVMPTGGVGCRHVAQPVAEDLRVGHFADFAGGGMPMSGANLPTPW